MTSLKQRLGEDFQNSKTVHLKGGKHDDAENFFEELPVVAVCSANRHPIQRRRSSDAFDSCDSSDGTFDTTKSSPLTSVLDLHSAEGPIETARLNASAEELGLTELVVNGVLSIYAIERRHQPSSGSGKTLGKDKMFGLAPHWEIPGIKSSDRGISALLSSIRVFADAISARNFDTNQQNLVLELFHRLTRFPPAVRALRILMQNSSLRSNECAAIAQPLFRSVRRLVPQALIKSDERRYFEGSRLVFGFLLCKVQEMKDKMPVTASDEQIMGPYLRLFRTVDLRDARTDEIIVHAVQTEIGLMERGCFEAFKPGGTLSKLGLIFPEISGTAGDQRELRAALLANGSSPEVGYYDCDVLQASLAREGGSDLVIELLVLSRHLGNLAVAIRQTAMDVVHPTFLKTAQAPVLSLDRDACLCVYVGRVACAAPDRDISVFRPVAAVEEAIDVNIVAQLIEAHIEARKVDGTLVFDLFSESAGLKEVTPTELLMVCVDCSASMNRGSAFLDEIGDAAEPATPDVTDDDLPALEELDVSVTLDDMKEWLSSYESFEDLLAMVKTTQWQKRTLASKILDFLSILTTREISEVAKELVKARSWASRIYLTDSLRPTEVRADNLRRVIGGLSNYQDALCDFLIFKSEGWSGDASFTWKYGDKIPQDETVNTGDNQVIDFFDQLTIPDDLLCPISHVVFEDPVTTVGNFTYDRRSIERWFQIRQSSPSTGLLLSDLSLRRNHVLYERSKRWLSAEDIRPTALRPGRTRFTTANSSDLDLNFVTPAGSFSRKVTSTLPLSDLYKVAFRGMRGAYKKFSLRLNGTLMEPSDQQLGPRHVMTGSTIVANATPESNNPSTVLADKPEMILVKVYDKHSHHTEMFSYWVPLNSTKTFASIIIRNWRFQHSRNGSTSKDQRVKCNVVDIGDGRQTADRPHHWNLMHDFIDNLVPKKLLDCETLCPESRAKDSGITSEEDIHMDEEYSLHYRTLKVSLKSYSTHANSEKVDRNRVRGLSRHAVQKLTFGPIIIRLLANCYPSMMGLVTIGSTAKLSQPLTSIIENFRRAIDQMEAKGSTPLWDGLGLAADQLISMSKKYPTAKKRIFCLSDGKDTSSQATALETARTMARNGIIVDSCTIGDGNHSALLTVSHLTGGFKFVPKKLEEAVGICELEPVISINERAAVTRQDIR